jgi:hypothetical protein
MNVHQYTAYDGKASDYRRPWRCLHAIFHHMTHLARCCSKLQFLLSTSHCLVAIILAVFSLVALLVAAGHCRVWSHMKFSACKAAHQCVRDVLTWVQQPSATAVVYVVRFYCYMFRSVYKEPSSGRRAQDKLQSTTPDINLPCPYVRFRSPVVIVTKFVTNSYWLV